LIFCGNLNEAIPLQSNGTDATERVAHRHAPRHVELALRERTNPKQLGQRTRHNGLYRVHYGNLNLKSKIYDPKSGI
jgi:hypothetical protein